MSEVFSFQDFENLQFGDVVYTAHLEDECFIRADKPENISFYLKWFVLYKNYDLYCSLFSASKETSSIGFFSLEEIFSADSKSFDSQKSKINESINKLDSKLKNNIDFNRSRILSGKWIHKFEKKLPIQIGGMNCCECNEYYHYAVPNLTNKKMACWVCRDSYNWKYSSLFAGN